MKINHSLNYLLKVTLCFLPFVILSTSSVAQPVITINAPSPPKMLPYPPAGLIGATKLRHYVATQYQPFCEALLVGKAEAVLPAIRRAYQQRPDNLDLYLIRSQADPVFRRDEWKLRRDQKNTDVNARLKRGVTLLYLFWEWRSQLLGTEVEPLLHAATIDLEDVWREKPSLIAGAALCDALAAGNKRRALLFNEEFLRFADPDHSWQTYQEAKSKGFVGISSVLNEVPSNKMDLVATILSERWSLLVSGGPNRKLPSQEALVLEKWWRDLAKRAPPI